MNKIHLAEKFTRFSAHWSPKIIAELNGLHVKLGKIKGEFVWHQHEHELFLVVKGRFRMEFRARHVDLHEGEMLGVPRGVAPRPVAENECCVMMFAPASPLNTGNAGGPRTVAKPDRI